jgi:hypothetical protein
MPGFLQIWRCSTESRRAPLAHNQGLQVVKTNSASIHEIRSALRPGLTFLWCIWAGLLFVPIVASFVNQSDEHHIPNWCLMTSSVVLAIVGWTWYAALQARDSTQQFNVARRLALLMTAGMTMGTLGDFFNAGRMQQVLHLPDPILGGLTAFLIGHLFYISACVLLARNCGFRNLRIWWSVVVAWQAVAVVGWYLVLFSPETDAVFLWAALPYSMLLAGTAGITCVLALHNWRLTLLAVGGVLFLVSDLILAYQITHERIFPNGEPVWLTYGPGQMFIVFAIGSMVSSLPHTSGPPTPIGTRLADGIRL